LKSTFSVSERQGKPQASLSSFNLRVFYSLLSRE
jgi:hypothetical protein